MSGPGHYSTLMVNPRIYFEPATAAEESEEGAGEYCAQLRVEQLGLASIPGAG